MLSTSAAVAVLRIEAYEDISYSTVYSPPEYRFETPIPGRTPFPGEAPTSARFRATVESVMAAAPRAKLGPGQSIYLIQAGGYRWGNAYEFEDDPMLRVGATYLMFLSPGPAVDAFGALPFGRFEVKGGVLEPDTTLRNLGVVRELSGVSVAQAETAVRGSAARVVVGGALPAGD